MKELKRLRLERGLSMADLARRTKLSRSEISRLERGERNPGMDTLMKLSRALNVGVAELFPPADPAKVEFSVTGLLAVDVFARDAAIKRASEEQRKELIHECDIELEKIGRKINELQHQSGMIHGIKVQAQIAAVPRPQSKERLTQ